MEKAVSAIQAQKRLRQFATKQNKETAMWFFKTGPGGYSQHDRFIGVKVPQTRLVSREFKDLGLSELQIILQSKIHEDRLLSLIVLVNRMKKASPKDQTKIAKFYIKNLKHVNNWDLVDSSAEHILGSYARNQLTDAQQRSLLVRLANSKNLWFRRISIMTTFHFIRNQEFANTLFIAELLLRDDHDLIHKAVGWMIREVGNRNYQAASDFLKDRYDEMPRTMLRYAIEKFPETRRKAYLLGKI